MLGILEQKVSIKKRRRQREIIVLYCWRKRSRQENDVCRNLSLSKNIECGIEIDVRMIERAGR
jgi:hypothetical protein